MAAGNNAFLLQGANPNNPFNNYRPGSLSTSAGSTTPQGNALNSFLTGSGSFMQPQTPAPAPNQPIKKQTITDAVGNTHVTEYHPPTPPGSPQAVATQQKSDVATLFPGLINQGGSTASTAPQPPVAPTNSTPGALAQNTQALTSQATNQNPTVTAATTGLNTIASNGGANTPAIQGATAGLLKQSATPSPVVQTAENDYARFTQQNPYILAAQSNPNVAADIASGRTSLLGKTFADVANAKQSAVANAISEQGQQITAGNAAGVLGTTAQGQQITAGTNAGNLGNTQQGNQITAATNAGSLASPGNTTLQASPGNTVYQVGPDGQLQQVTNGVSSYANFSTLQQVQSLSSQYPDAVNSQGQRFNYDPTLSPQQNADNFRDNYLPNSGTFQKSKFGVAGATSPNSAAAISANAGSIGDLTSQINTLSASRNSVATISNGLISQIAQNSNLNPANLTSVNEAIQSIANQTGNPQYQTLLNRMTDIAATYGQILTPGGNTDSTRATASDLINKLASGESIQQVIQGLDTQAQEKIYGSQKTVSAIQSGQNPNPTSSQITPTSSGNGSTYQGITLPN